MDSWQPFQASTTDEASNPLSKLAESVDQVRRDCLLTRHSQCHQLLPVTRRLSSMASLSSLATANENMAAIQARVTDTVRSIYGVLVFDSTLDQATKESQRG